MHERKTKGCVKKTVQCPSFMIFCFSPTTHGKCSGHWTKNFNGHGTVSSEQRTLATWRRIPASGSMSKPSQKLTPWLCMLWLLSNLFQSWQQGLIFQSKFCHCPPLPFGMVEKHSPLSVRRSQGNMWTVNEQTIHMPSPQSLFIRQTIRHSRSLVYHGLPHPTLVHWNLVKDQVVCVLWWQREVKHASYLETTPAGSTSRCWRGWGPSTTVLPTFLSTLSTVIVLSVTVGSSFCGGFSL